MNDIREEQPALRLLPEWVRSILVYRILPIRENPIMILPWLSFLPANTVGQFGQTLTIFLGDSLGLNGLFHILVLFGINWIPFLTHLCFNLTPR